MSLSNWHSLMILFVIVLLLASCSAQEAQGTPEMGLQSAAMVEMGRYYDLPSSSAGCTSDAKEPGPQAVLEKLVTTFPPVSVGSDIIVGFGEIESDQLLILEQLVVDNEIAHFCERLQAGVDSSAVQDLYADIAQIGPGGNFLKSRQTRLAARSNEFFTPSLIGHHSYEAWLNLGKPTMYNRAREKVEEILAAPLVDPMPESISRELDEILLAADKELATKDYRVLRKYLNQNPVIFEPFDTGKFIDLCKKQ